MIPSDKDDADLGADLLNEDAEFDDAWDDFLELEHDEDAGVFDAPTSPEDFEQAGQSDISETPSKTSKKKAGAPIKAGLALILLSAAGAGGYYYYSQIPQKKPVIVQIEPELINSVKTTENAATAENEEEIVTFPQQPLENITIAPEAPLSQNESKFDTVDNSGPLTPLPTNLEGLQVELPDLDTTNESDTLEITEQENVVSDNTINTDEDIIVSDEITIPVITEFNEDAMLSKTETSPEPIDVQEIENATITSNSEEQTVPTPEEGTHNDEITENASLNDTPEGTQAIVKTVDQKKSEPQKIDTKIETKKVKSITINWQIRAAQPGKAVIYDRINDVMRSVEIGDYLAETGKITHIQKVNGKWTISGSKGKITN